ITHAIAERLAKADNAPMGSNERKIGDFYASGMDEAGIEKAGIWVLADEMKSIKKINSVDDLQYILAHLHQFGIDVAFGFGSGQDFKDSNSVIAQASQGGLGLPDRDYYTNTDDNSKKIRDQYVAHISKMFQLTGVDKP